MTELVRAKGHKRRVWLPEEDEPILSKTPSPILQTKNNAVINYTQTQQKVDTNLTQQTNTNQTHTEHNHSIPNTNYTQTTHKPNTKLNTTKTQSRHKVDTNLTQTKHISIVIGVQRMILLFIFEDCKKARSHTTEPLSAVYIANALEIAVGSVKTSITRLCEKSFLKVNCFKNGRGGWTQYEIPEDTYKELLQMETQHKLHTNLTQSRHKPNTKPNTQPNTSLSSSNSNINNITTTELRDDWKIDLTPYRVFGFSETQLKQLAELKTITPEKVEMSLIEYKYDFDNKLLPKGASLNLLMGVMRKGGTWTSETYRKEEDRLINEKLEQAEKRRKADQMNALRLWESELTNLERDKISKIIPIHLRASFMARQLEYEPLRTWLIDYYAKIKYEASSK
jgi:hypothetical protein